MTYTKEREQAINDALALVKEAQEKGEIEYSFKGDAFRREFCDSPLGLQNPDLDYRAKPAPLEGWVNILEFGTATLHPKKEHAIEVADANCQRVAVHVREVTE